MTVRKNHHPVTRHFFGVTTLSKDHPVVTGHIFCWFLGKGGSGGYHNGH